MVVTLTQRSSNISAALSPIALPPKPTPDEIKAKRRKALSEEVRAYCVNDASIVSGLSRSTLYELVAAQKLRTVKIGGRRLIPRDALEALLQGVA